MPRRFSPKVSNPNGWIKDSSQGPWSKNRGVANASGRYRQTHDPTSLTFDHAATFNAILKARVVNLTPLQIYKRGPSYMKERELLVSFIDLIEKNGYRQFDSYADLKGEWLEAAHEIMDKYRDIIPDYFKKYKMIPTNQTTDPMP